MSSIYLSFSPKLTRMFVRLYILLRSRSYVKMDIFLRLTELCQVFKILEVFLQVKFTLIFMSEKPNLLKLSKSNIFVMISAVRVAQNKRFHHHISVYLLLQTEFLFREISEQKNGFLWKRK